MTALPSHVPLPLEWHPAYDGDTWLRDWLNGRGPHRDQCTVFVSRVIATPAVDYMSPAELYPTTIEQRHWTLTRHRCGGPAPYVGRPFRYEWMVGIDELGRGVAGESRRVWDLGRAFTQYLADTPESEWPLDDWMAG